MTTAPHHARADALFAAAASTPGFLPIDEATALYGAARRAARSGLGPLAEIGGYLGRSALFIAAAIAAEGEPTVLFSVDHHHGSEELQAGWQDHDPTLVDPTTGQMETLMAFRHRIDAASAGDLVIAVVGDSATVGAHWQGDLSLIFIDGGHGAKVCRDDYDHWAPHVAPGGMLVFHDVFSDPSAGGQAPFDCYRDALSSGGFREDDPAGTGSLRILLKRR